MNNGKFKQFIVKHPIIFNLLLIIITFFVLMYGVLFLIDSFTGHGVYSVVPDVKGLSLVEATKQIESAGFKCEIADSTYSDTFAPGMVVDQEPKAESKIKPLRTVYLTMNAVSPKVITVPSIVDMSCRQGIAVLNGIGLKDITVDTVYSPYKDLILSVRANGKEVTPGVRLPQTSKITISIGNGLGEVLPDSIEIENILSDSLETDID